MAQKKPKKAPEVELQPEPQACLIRASVGSVRRIKLTMENLYIAMTDAALELDQQVHMLDENGKSAGNWPVTGDIRALRDDINQKINELLAQ